MHDALLPPGQPTYRNAMTSGWRLLRQRFKPLSGAILIYFMLLLIGFITLGILNAISPANTDLWRFPMYLWTYVLNIGLYRLLATALADRTWSVGDLLWGAQRVEAWTLSMLPAALGAIFVAVTGFAATPGHPLPPSTFTRPDFWLEIFAWMLVGFFFQYAFMLFAVYGASLQAALRDASRIFGSRLVWLFFPFVLTLFILLASVIYAIPVGLIVGALSVLSKSLLSSLIARIVLVALVVFSMALLTIALVIWMSGSLLIATGALADHARPEGRLIP